MGWVCFHEWHVVAAESRTIPHDDGYGHSWNRWYTFVSKVCSKCGRTKVGVLRGNHAARESAERE